MSSSVLIAYSLLFIEVSSVSELNFFNYDDEDSADLDVYRSVIDIYKKNKDVIDVKIIGLMVDDAKNFNFPIKILHEHESAVILTPNHRTRVDSLFLRVKCLQDTKSITSDLLQLAKRSQTVAIMSTNPEEFYLHEIETWMIEIFETFWNKHVSNVVFAFSNRHKMLTENSSNGTALYVFEPFEENRLKKVTESKWTNIFYNKAVNLHGYPLKILGYNTHRFKATVHDKTYELSGIDGAVALQFRHIFNATLDVSYLQTTGNKFDSSESIEESKNALMNSTFDIWMNARMFTPNTFQKLSFSYPRERMDVTCVLPKRRKNEIPYKNLLGGRVGLICLLIVFTFCLMAACVVISSRILRQKMPVLKMAKMILNQSDVILQRPCKFTVRILLGTWLVFSLMSSTSLQTFIASRIIRPKVAPRLLTIQEVANSNVILRMGLMHWELTRSNFEDQILSSIANNLQVVPDNELFRVYGPDVGYMVSKDMVRFINRERSKVYIVQETFLPNLVSYSFPRKSPLLERVDKSLSAMEETGLTQKAAWDNLHGFNMTGTRSQESASDVTYINIKHLQGVFSMYGFGMLLGLIVFIFELYCH